MVFPILTTAVEHGRTWCACVRVRACVLRCVCVCVCVDLCLFALPERLWLERGGMLKFT